MCFFKNIDVADQLARAEASLIEPNSENGLILYSNTDPQLEPSLNVSDSRSRNLRSRNQNSQPTTPKLQRKGRPIKKTKDSYPTPAQIRRMEALSLIHI